MREAAAVNEAEQIWREIVEWWAANGANELRARRPGATKRAIAAAEKRLGCALPDDLAAVLRACDGGPSFESYELLSLAEIVSTWSSWGALLAGSELKSRPIADPRALRKWWSAGWVPFARDSCGNLECIDVGTVKPRRIRLEVQDGQGAYAVAGSFTRWLRGYLDRLKAGALVVDADGNTNEKTVLPDAVETGPARPELTGKDLASVRAALKKDDPERVLALLDGRKLGPDVDLEYNRSLLGIAAEERRTKVLRALLERGADIDAADDNGRTALFWAAWGPKPDLALVKLLLERGANPNRRTKFDGTPLHSAIMWEDAEVVAAMVRAGADPSAADASGQTARAAAAGKKVDMGKATGVRAARTRKNAARELRIAMEIVVDAYNPDERALGWYTYLQETLEFPFTANCMKKRPVSPLQVGDEVDVIGMPELEECRREMWVTIRWERDGLAVPLSQLKPIADTDEETREAVADWLYWVEMGYCF